MLIGESKSKANWSVMLCIVCRAQLDTPDMVGKQYHQAGGHYTPRETARRRDSVAIKSTKTHQTLKPCRSLDLELRQCGERIGLQELQQLQRRELADRRQLDDQRLLWRLDEAPDRRHGRCRIGIGA